MNTCLLAVLAAVVACASAQISCYQCVSSVNDKCDSSDLNDLAQYKKPCASLTSGTYSGNPPVGCRKVVQKVEEDPITIYRECAYSGGPVDGQKKTGNWAVSKLFYQCENEKPSEPCNGATTPSLLFSSLALLIAVLFH